MGAADGRATPLGAAVLGAALLLAGCGGPPAPVFVSPAEGEVPQAPDVLVEVAAEGAPAGSDLALFVGNVRVTSGPGENRITYVWDTTGITGEVTLWAELTTPSGARSEASRTVTVVAQDSSPPGVEFVWPLDGQTVSGEVVLEVQATGARASEVEAVRFELDGALLAEDSMPDFWYAWDTSSVTEGAHTLRAMGRYGNAYTEPAEITVHVSNSGSSGPISVTITAPSDGSTVTGTVTVKAAIEHDNDIYVVEFYVDDVLMHSTNASPWQWVWDALSSGEGPHTLRVRAVDQIGNEAEASVDVEVAVGDALDVRITQPTEGEVITADYQVLCEVTLAAPLQVIHFYLDDGTEPVRSTTSETDCKWAWGVTSALASGELLPGEHTIRVVATDEAGAEASDSVTVTVAEGG